MVGAHGVLGPAFRYPEGSRLLNDPFWLIGVQLSSLFSRRLSVEVSVVQWLGFVELQISFSCPLRFQCQCQGQAVQIQAGKDEQVALSNFFLCQPVIPPSFSFRIL